MSRKIATNDSNLPFKDKEKEGGEGKSQFGGQWKVPMFGGPWKEKEKHLFNTSQFPPNLFLLKPSFFPFDLKVLIYHGSKLLLMHFLPFFLHINYNHTSWCNKSSTHSLPIWFWSNIFFPFLEIMASCMATSYELQVAQVKEELASKSSLDLTLTQHLYDEDPKLWEVCAHLEIDPPWTWYYHIFLNFRTLVILLQIDPAFGDKLETICEGC